MAYHDLASGEVATDQLKQAVEGLHGGSAAFSHAVEVHERFKGETVWEGVVHVFDLKGHPSATKAYAWSYPIEGTTRRKFYAILHCPPVASPVEAVRAAIASGQ